MSSLRANGFRRNEIALEQRPLQFRYTRSDPKGLFPVRSGLPDLEHNRLAVFWRPIIDLADSELSAMRLRAIPVVSAWLADPADHHWSWFSRIGVPGLRHQVLRHAGLDRYDCREPTGLPAHLRSTGWTTLVTAIANFAELGWRERSLVVFHLAQLSYVQFALGLAGEFPAGGGDDPARDRYLYDLARVHARYPGHVGRALAMFERLAATSSEPLVAMGACFQGIGHSLRRGQGGDGIGWAKRFEQAGRAVSGLPEGWHAALVRSRFHRAVALLRLVEGDREGVGEETATAFIWHEQLGPEHLTGAESMVAAENRRYLVELRVEAAKHFDVTTLPALCEELIGLDPYCVEARLAVGDGYAAVNDYESAAHWYARAGELGTGSGAVGWFRAGQCYEMIGDRGNALNAMGRCLELDNTAVEAQAYLAGVDGRSVAQPR